MSAFAQVLEHAANVVPETTHGYHDEDGQQIPAAEICGYLKQIGGDDAQDEGDDRLEVYAATKPELTLEGIHGSTLPRRIAG